MAKNGKYRPLVGMRLEMLPTDQYACYEWGLV